jgi:hypothetical protein
VKNVDAFQSISSADVDCWCDARLLSIF